MKTIVETLAQISNEEEREQIINIMQIVEDPLSRDILGKLTSPHSPILANKISRIFTNQSKINILDRMKRMAEAKLIKSTLTDSDEGMVCRKYEITKYGRKIAETYAKYEIEKYSQYLTKIL